MKIAFFSMNRNFAQPILQELNQHHQLRVWQHNSSEWINQQSIANLMNWCDVAYCEWLQPPNMEISQIQGWDKPIVAFCHGIDALNHYFMDWRNISGLIIQDALYPRFMRLRETWPKQNPGRLPLAKLPPILTQSIGVDLTSFKVQPRKFGYHIITHASSMRPTKRVYEAIQQFYDLIKVDISKPWKMTIVGDWYDEWELNQRREYLEALEELLDTLNFPQGRIFITDRNFDKDTWRSFLQTADVYWCTSWRESFGSSLMEAVASGVYPFVNYYLGADKLYPDIYLCKTPGEFVENTRCWGAMNDETKETARQTSSAIAAKYDQKKAAERIRLFVEQTKESYHK
jgi:hypothetical protein